MIITKHDQNPVWKIINPGALTSSLWWTAPLNCIGYKEGHNKEFLSNLVVFIKYF